MTNTQSKQIPINFFTNIGVFTLNIFVNLFITPFYIRHLGVDGFGVVQLALLLPIYINLATLIISGSVSRFLTIALHEKNYNNANITFNTSFFSISTILMISIPIMIYFALNITSFLKIPTTYSGESIGLFVGIFLSSLITIFSTLFLIPAYANNRLDVQNYIKIATLFIQTSVIVLTFIFIASNIAYVGYSYIISALTGLILSILVWKEFAPFLRISKSFVEIAKFKEIASMGSWLLINQLGSILFLSVDLIIINHYFGAEATGKYSIVLQWSVLLRSLAGMIASVLDPIILISYAKKNFEEIIQYSNLAVKFMGILIAIPIGLIMGFGTPLFSLWLGPEFIKLVPLLWLMIGPLAINLSVIPLFSINTAYNKVKIPGLISLAFGFANLLLAILFSVTFEMGIYGVAIAGAVVLSLKNVIFTPLYAASILKIEKFTFFKFIFYSLIIEGITFALAYSVTKFINIENFLVLGILLIAVTILILIFIWTFLLKKSEKEIIKIKLKRGK